MINRRKLLALAGAQFLTRVAGADSGLIINSARPKDYEMELGGFKDWITPIDHFYVRNHHYTPDVKLSDWSLKVDGLVDTPSTLSLTDLKKLPRASQTAVMECAGNGRSFYEPHVPGMQWKYGGVANGKWTGARLVDVLKRAGLKDGAKEILFSGEDIPIGKQPKFERTVALRKAFDPDTLLAYELNDKPIPMEHGFPLRLIVPGWAGDSWVKWVKHIEVLDHEYDGFWMKVAYRHPTHPVAPGTAVPPQEMVPVTDLAVKSVIASPVAGWAGAPGKELKISGAAWANGVPIEGVDVSVDGGKTWRKARLGHDQARYAWRLWSLEWKPQAEGSYQIVARAKDAAGNIQPIQEQWNPSGYLWNVAAPRTVTISRTEQPASSEPKPQPQNQPVGFKSTCLTCHGEDIIRMQRLTGAQWDREVSKMVGWGAEIKPADKEGILNYLKSNFKQ